MSHAAELPADVPELIALGNLLVDDIVEADGRTRMAQAGGALLYVGLAARLGGLSIGLVSRRGDDYPAMALEALVAHGIDLAGVVDLGRPGLRTWLLQEGRVRQIVHRLEGPSHADVSPRPADIPPAWLASARAFHLAPMPFTVQCELVEMIREARPDALLSLDPTEVLHDADLPRWRPLLDQLDLLFLSEDEMFLTGSPADALKRLTGGRLRHVVFKRGARGGMLLERLEPQQLRQVCWEPITPRGGVVDTTGAGDAFAAGFLASTLLGDRVERAAQRGADLASLAIGGQGPAGLLEAWPEPSF